MANTYTARISVPGNIGLVTIPHNLGKTPHYLTALVLGSIAPLGLIWSEVSGIRDRSVIGLETMCSVDGQNVRWTAVFINSMVR